MWSRLQGQKSKDRISGTCKTNMSDFENWGLFWFLNAVGPRTSAWSSEIYVPGPTQFSRKKKSLYPLTEGPPFQASSLGTLFQLLSTAPSKSNFKNVKSENSAVVNYPSHVTAILLCVPQLAWNMPILEFWRRLFSKKTAHFAVAAEFSSNSICFHFAKTCIRKLFFLSFSPQSLPESLIPPHFHCFLNLKFAGNRNSYKGKELLSSSAMGVRKKRPFPSTRRVFENWFPMLFYRQPCKMHRSGKAIFFPGLFDRKKF